MLGLILVPPIIRKIFSTQEVARLTGFSASTINKYEREGNLPQALRVSRMKFYFLDEVLAWMNCRGLPSKADPTQMGKPYLEVPPGDRLLTSEEVMEMLNVNRSWFQEGLKNGLFPPPDLSFGVPFPNQWLESTVRRWQNSPQHRYYFREHQPDIFRVSVDGQPIGIVQRINVEGEWKWQPIGCHDVMEKIKAAQWLHNRKATEIPLKSFD